MTTVVPRKISGHSPPLFGRKGKGVTEMIEVNAEIGQATETVTLPADGKVTGELRITWLSRGRAHVVAEKVEYRGRVFTVVHAQFKQDDDAWWFVPESMHEPVRVPAGMFDKPAAPTFRDAVIAAVSAALKAAWSPDTARTVGRVDVEREIRRAEATERDLLRQLAQVRDALVILRKQHARYTED